MAKKNKFDAIPMTWKDALDGASMEDLKAKMAEVAKAEEMNQSAMKADQDLNQKRELVKLASAGYRDETKLNKLKRGYLMQQLADKGDPDAQQTIQNLINAESQKGG